MKRVLCIGHTTYDAFLIVESADVHCDINNKNCSVCFGFGDKIPVEKAIYSIGGGAANVSAGLSALDIDVSLYTYLGKDQYGKFLKKELKKHGVGLDLVEEDSFPTDSSVIISYGIDRTIFTYNHDRKFGYPKQLDDFDVVFVSSIGAYVDDVYDAIKNYKKLKPKSLVIFSPGSKELADSIESVRDFAKYADIFIGNVEEGVRLFSSKHERGDVVLKDVIDELKSIYSKTIVLTDGAKGVYIGESNDFHHIQSIPMKVVEKTGAGDAFASGFVAGKLNGNSNIESAQWGIVNSISMIQSYGAHAGLLKKEALLSTVSKYWPN